MIFFSLSISNSAAASTTGHSATPCKFSKKKTHPKIQFRKLTQNNKQIHHQKTLFGF